jgi:general secretion pathway protein F
MSLWRYRALPIAGGASPQIGEVAGESAAEVRAALRRVGLQVLELRPAAPRIPRIQFDSWHRYLRRRRVAQRAELYDSMATMIESGTPLVSALDTIVQSEKRLRGRKRSMLLLVRESVRSGSTLASALEAHKEWFAPDEVAIVAAGEHGGNLAAVLRSLSSRNERSGELRTKLVAALSYPAIVACVGMGAFLFLSNKTLPELCTILRDSKVEVPALTAAVMGAGQFTLKRGGWLVLAAIACGVGVVFLGKALASRGVRVPSSRGRLSPAVFQTIALARISLALSDLLRAGVPLVEALRTLGPTAVNRGFRGALTAAADRVERGAPLAESLTNDRYFDAEFRRLVEIGEESGELDSVLEKVGFRRERKAQRQIERLASWVEPASILVLASLIGVVAMAAILPIVRLQEIL